MAAFRVPGRRTVLVNRPDLARRILQEQVSGIRQRRHDLTQLEFVQWPASHWTRTGDRSESVARRVGSSAAHPAAAAGGPAVTLDRVAALVDSCCELFVEQWLRSGAVELRAAMGALTAGLVRSVLLGHEPDAEAGQVLSDALIFALSDRREPAGAGRADRQRWQSTVRALRDQAMSSSRYHGVEAARQASGFAPLIMAAYSPTSAALTWIAYLLATHPDALAAVRAEVGDRPPARAAGAPFLKAVVRESLRLYPPGPALVRFTHEATELDEYVVPAGARVLVSPYLLQRHPDLWPRPEAFRPERFTEEPPQQAYLPFGLGPGTCPGKAICILLLHLTVAALARRFTLNPDWTTPPQPELRWALLPNQPLPATLTAPGGVAVPG